MERLNAVGVAAEADELEDPQRISKFTSQQRPYHRKRVCHYEDQGRAAARVAVHAEVKLVNREIMTSRIMTGMVRLRRCLMRAEVEAVVSAAVEGLLDVEAKHHRWPNWLQLPSPILLPHRLAQALWLVQSW